MSKERRAAKEAKREWERPSESPFQCLSGSLDHHTANFCIVTWSGQADEPTRSPNKDTALQDASWLCLKEVLHALSLAREAGSAHDASAAESILAALLHSDSEDSGLLALGTRQARTPRQGIRRPIVCFHDDDDDDDNDDDDGDDDDDNNGDDEDEMMSMSMMMMMTTMTTTAMIMMMMMMMMMMTTMIMVMIMIMMMRMIMMMTTMMMRMMRMR